MTAFSQVMPVATCFSCCSCRCFFSKLWLSMNFLLARTNLSLTSFSGCACSRLFLQVEPVADFFSGCAHRLLFPRPRPSLIFLQVTHVADFFSGSHEYVDGFLLRLRTSLTFFTGADFFFRLCLSMTCFLQVAPVATFFFLLDLPLQFFFKLCLSMDFLPARTSPSLTSFSGCARRCFFFHRSLPSLTSISGCAHRWLFPRSRLSLILPQVTHVADFFPGRTSTSMTSFSGCAHRWLFFLCRARWWFFSRLRTSLFSFSWSHGSLADFFCRLCLSWTVFSQVAPVATFFFMLVLPLFFFQVVLIDGFFASSHESFPDFFFSLRTSLTFFTGRARCWFLFQVAHIAHSFPGRARRWFFPGLRMSLIIFPGGTSTSMTSFLGCAHRWRFHWSRPLLTIPQVTQVADFFFLFARFPHRLLFQIVPVNDCFFTGRASRNLFFMLFLPLFFFQVVAIDELFASSHESFADFFFRLRPSLNFFTGRARCWHFS